MPATSRRCSPSIVIRLLRASTERVRRPGTPRSPGPGRRAHGLGEQLAVLPAATTRAVLVVLDLHQRRLGVTGEARDRPRVRVGLLELVDRLRDQQLLPLRQGHGSLHVAGGARPRQSPVHGVEGSDEPALAGDVGKGPGQVADRGAQLGLERRLQSPPQREEGRRPLPRLVDVGETAVVQLVEAPQRQLGVAVGHHGARHARRQRAEAALGHLVRRGHEQAERRVAEGTSSTRDAGRRRRRARTAVASLVRPDHHWVDVSPASPAQNHPFGCHPPPAVTSGATCGGLRTAWRWWRPRTTPCSGRPTSATAP